MKKVGHPNPKDGFFQLLILGLLLSFSVGLYLAFATVNGRTISIIFAVLLILGIFVTMFKRHSVILPLLNSVYGFVLLVYFLLTMSSTDEILTGGSCMDICLGEAFIFHFVKVFAVLPIFFSGYLLSRLLLEKKLIKELWHRIIFLALLLFSVLIFFYFLITF